jgi:hypothetical protein
MIVATQSIGGWQHNYSTKTSLYGGNPSQNLRQLWRKLHQKRFMKLATGSRAAKLQNLQK